MTAPRVRIVGVPPGEAPDKIREQWVGLELPLAEGRSDVYQLNGEGLFSGHPKPEKYIGYVVLADDAIRVLEHKSPEAAEWWRTNVPRLFSSGRALIFPEYVCEKIDSKPA